MQIPGQDWLYHASASSREKRELWFAFFKSLETRSRPDNELIAEREARQWIVQRGVEI